MKPHTTRLYLTALLIIIFLLPCACMRGRTAAEQHIRVYHRPYEEVWEAVTGLVLNELGCVDRKMNKRRGRLETEWVHSFDTTGHRRWKIEARLRQRKDAVAVTFTKTMQLRDDVSRTMRRYEQKEQKEPVGPHAGWSKTAASPREIEDLYRRLELRLGE